MNFNFSILFTILLFGFQFLSFGQEPTDLPDPDPQFLTDEYELIILDGDTLLRSKLTKEVYSKQFKKRAQNASTGTFKTDWMNAYWDTKTFNPYKDAEPVVWPLSISFSGERFTMPIEGVITSRFGWRKGRPHKGIDIDLVTGDNVLAAMDGKVRFAKYYSGFGNCVVIRHHNGLETIYAHLSKILVEPNTYINSGQVIGKGGNTGRSRGSHLHFETRWFNQSINPEYFFDFETTKFFNAQELLVDKIWTDPRKHRSYKKSNIIVKQPGGYLSKPMVQTTPTPNPNLTSTENNTTTASTLPNTATSIEKTTTTDSGFRKGSSTSSSIEKQADEYHVISKGETLGKIAKAYNTTVNELCRINGINKTSILKIGRQIKIR